MRLLNHLSEARTDNIEEKRAIPLIKKHCKKSLDAFVKGKAGIYRGNSSVTYDYGYINPKKGNPRQSAFASGNHYTVLLDTLPSWKKYPKRSQSVIATTDIENAINRGMGSYYIVLPYDGAKIGVCSEEDIWVSFPNLGLDNWDNELEGLNEWLFDNGIVDTNMKNQLSKITNKNYHKLLSKDIDPPTREFGNILHKWIKQTKEMSLWDTLNDSMSPKKNLFELKKAGDAIHHTAEVWTDSECFLVHYTNRQFLIDTHKDMR